MKRPESANVNFKSSKEKETNNENNFNHEPVFRPISAVQPASYSYKLANFLVLLKAFIYINLLSNKLFNSQKPVRPFTSNDSIVNGPKQDLAKIRPKFFKMEKVLKFNS